MSDLDYTSLRELLESRLAVIADGELRENAPEEQLRQLQQTSEAITEWHAENKGAIPAQLNHFLKQSSLSKALDYVQEL